MTLGKRDKSKVRTPCLSRVSERAGNVAAFSFRFNRLEGQRKSVVHGLEKVKSERFPGRGRKLFKILAVQIRQENRPDACTFCSQHLFLNTADRQN